MTKMIFVATLLMLNNNAKAHLEQISSSLHTPILADLSLLKKANIPTLYSDEEINIGYTVASEKMLQELSKLAHEKGRCGNFEALNEIPQNLNTIQSSFDEIRKINHKNLTYLSLANKLTTTENPIIIDALKELSSEKIRETVQWLSSYPTRYNRGTDANRHVTDFANKLKDLSLTAAYPVAVDTIAHRNTPQKTIRVSIQGSTKPNEIVVLGGHLDSINGWMGKGNAPGADDNASGSASLFEALRVLLTKAQPERTVEFFWYAGEESGLLGSAEVAETYKVEKKNVIAVLQLDMTLFPGNGLFRIASMTDFTSPWLRDYLTSINNTYLKVEILEDQCGYGCSDHASWFRRGFPTLMPTEAKFNSMFKDIHTDRDVINPQTSFEHALVFSKIALIMSLDLANSQLQEPNFN